MHQEISHLSGWPGGWVLEKGLNVFRSLGGLVRVPLALFRKLPPPPPLLVVGQNQLTRPRHAKCSFSPHPCPAVILHFYYWLKVCKRFRSNFVFKTTFPFRWEVASGGDLSLFFAWTSRIQSIATTTMIPGEGWCRAELRLFRLTHFANWPKMSATLSNASFEAISPHRQSRRGLAKN